VNNFTYHVKQNLAKTKKPLSIPTKQAAPGYTVPHFKKTTQLSLKLFQIRLSYPIAAYICPEPIFDARVPVFM
jgi:hypothetical protein